MRCPMQLLRMESRIPSRIAAYLRDRSDADSSESIWYNVLDIGRQGREWR